MNSGTSFSPFFHPKMDVSRLYFTIFRTLDQPHIIKPARIENYLLDSDLYKCSNTERLHFERSPVW